MLAADSGLYIMNTNGMIMYTITEGNFNDILVLDKDTVLIFHQKTGRHLHCSNAKGTWVITEGEVNEVGPNRGTSQSDICPVSNDDTESPAALSLSQSQNDKTLYDTDLTLSSGKCFWLAVINCIQFALAIVLNDVSDIHITNLQIVFNI